MKRGDVDFNTICTVLKIRPTTLKRWLGTDKSLYKCAMGLHQPIYASGPREVGLAFSCFECEHRE